MHVYIYNVAGLQSKFPTSTKTNSNKNVCCKGSEIGWKFSKKRPKMNSFY